MITKKEAKEITENYLKVRKRKYTTICDIEKIRFGENEKLLYGKYADTSKNVYVINYGVMWGNEERNAFLYVSANNGEILYTINSHGWVEELEDN